MTGAKSAAGAGWRVTIAAANVWAPESGIHGENQLGVWAIVYPSGSPAWSLLVGHDGVFKVVLLALLDLPLERFWSFAFGLTGITIVGIHDGVVVLQAHNLLDHLAPLQDAGPGDDEEADRAASGAL